MHILLWKMHSFIHNVFLGKKRTSNFDKVAEQRNPWSLNLPLGFQQMTKTLLCSNTWQKSVELFQHLKLNISISMGVHDFLSQILSACFLVPQQRGSKVWSSQTCMCFQKRILNTDAGAICKVPFSHIFPSRNFVKDRLVIHMLSHPLIFLLKCMWTDQF